MTPQFPLDRLDTLSLPSVAPADSFAHMVEQGWDAGGEEDLESMPEFLTYGVAETGDDLFGVGPLSIQDGLLDPSDVEGTHVDLPFEEMRSLYWVSISVLVWRLLILCCLFYPRNLSGSKVCGLTFLETDSS